jgi:hypothetical protein
MPEGVGYGPQYTATTGLSLNVIGNWFYAYSGDIPSTTGLVEKLNFTTGKGVHVGTFQFNGPADDAAANAGDISVCLIQLNGVAVSTLKTDTEDSYNGLTSVTQELLIPPFTLVQCSVISSANASDRKASLTFSGKIYK